MPHPVRRPSSKGAPLCSVRSLKRRARARLGMRTRRSNRPRQPVDEGRVSGTFVAQDNEAGVDLRSRSFMRLDSVIGIQIGIG